MSEGRAGEFAHPYKLLVKNVGDETITNQDSKFAQMVMATGLETAQSLFEIAKQQYFQQIVKYPDDQNELLTMGYPVTIRDSSLPSPKAKEWTNNHLITI